MYNLVLFILFMLSIAIIGLQIKISSNRCPPPQIIYSYIPRTFEEEQKNPTNLTYLFKDMFENKSVMV